MELKVGDFGLATKLEFEGDRKRTICGTPNYIAPEILDGKQGHSYEVDIWSFGVILYTLIIGKPPFEASDIKSTYKRIKGRVFSYPENAAITPDAKSLIDQVLNLDPTKRPALDEITNHPFFHSGAIPKLLPTSTLACPPPSSYVKRFNTSSPNVDVYVLSKPRLENTVPIQANDFTQETKPSAPLISKAEIKEDPTAPLRTLELPRSGQSGATAVWVKRWVDYSSKYGLGYLLSSGSYGVFFNDSTKIVLDSDGEHFSYVEKRSSDKQDMVRDYTLSEYPIEQKKKVLLLQHFKGYLDGNSKKTAGDEGKEEFKVEARKMLEEVEDRAPLIYVKKWMRTKHAILFRLSNKVVQVTFQDRTEIVLSSETREVTYANKKGERSTHPLSTALESANPEMSKRLKYAKDILAHMLTANQQRNVR
eukprot:TRINITY_DN12740_c0_g1_i1.p1 TRINITY_DN12740_c0_g1~~TRINITY_DN12740_c0_g1_i1.p1  ORF type:complete len:421 (+),score=118.53 TRINITY_DN12740_c0_g1_i1:740-2002(+)